MSKDRYEKWETNNIYQWFEETIKACLQDEVICLIRMIRDKKEEMKRYDKEIVPIPPSKKDKEFRKLLRYYVINICEAFAIKPLKVVDKETLVFGMNEEELNNFCMNISKTTIYSFDDIKNRVLSYMSWGEKFNPDEFIKLLSEEGGK
jgi:hypothetical protein